MGKLLRTRDILLLGLGGALDLFDELKDPGEIMSKSYESMYGFVPRRYKRNNYAHLVWRNLKTGYIEKVVKDGEVYLRLTNQGQEKISRDFPLLQFQKKPWDKKWRLILFDISEINRNRRDMLREKLKELGFGMFQKSAYISPNDFTKDLVEFLAEVKLVEHVYVFEIYHTQLATGNSKTLARKVWNLEEVNDRYLRLIDEIDRLISIHDRGHKLNDEMGGMEGKKLIIRDSDSERRKRKSFTEKVREIKENYMNLLLNDPFLPKELLPDDWALPRLKTMIRKLSRI
jgi:CRISPR-associated endonuclease Cas2